MINSFNGSSSPGVQLGFNASGPALTFGGISGNGGNISGGNGGLTTTQGTPQVLGLTPLWPCCETITTPGTNGCLTFSITINGNVTQGGIGAIVTPPGGLSKSWLWFSPPSTPLNCHAWAIDFPNVMNVIFPNLSVTVTAPVGSSCTVQICPKNATAYGTTIQFVKCSATGGGTLTYSPNICNQTFTLGTAPVSYQDTLGCGDCRQGNYTADIVPDDKALELPVFADPNNSGYATSDYTTFLLLYPNGYDAIASRDFSLEHLVGGSFQKITDITDRTLGIPFNNFLGTNKFPFYSSGAINFSTPFISPIVTSCSFINYQGFFLDWRLVFNTYGAGTYRFAVNGHTYGNGVGTTYCFKSNPFCLSQFDCHAADRTVKFEAFYTGGNRGDVNTQGNYWPLSCNDSNPFFWADSIRFYGFLGRQTDDIQRDQIKYQTGTINKVRDELIKKYELHVSPMPQWFHDRFAAYALMADQLYVTDNNYNNANYNLKRFWIVADSGWEPAHVFESRYARIEGSAKFKEGQQFVFSDRC